MVYKIKKGKHYPEKICLPRIFFGKDRFRWKVLFSDQCWYPIGVSNDDYDINKLCGVFLGFRKANGSFRVGWLPDFEKKGYIKLYAYGYIVVNGTKVPNFKYLLTVKTNTYFTVKLLVIGKSNRIVTLRVERDANLTDQTIGEWATASFDEVSKCRSGIIHRPYHGGNLTAPNDYTIEVVLENIE